MPGIIEILIAFIGYFYLAFSWHPTLSWQIALLCTTAFSLTRLYRRYRVHDWRILNFYTLLFLLFTAFLPVAIFGVWLFIERTLPADILGPVGLLLFLLLLNRVGWYFYLNPVLFRKKEGQTPILIYGAGSVAHSLLQEISSTDLTGKYKIVGFVDNNAAKINTRLGAYLIHPRTQILSLIQKEQVKELWFTMPPSAALMRQTMAELNNIPLQYKIVPRKLEHILPDIRSLRIEDLVRRNEIRLDSTPVQKLIQHKRILITGAAGSIGSEIVRQLLQYEPAQLSLLDQWEFGVYQLEREFQNYKNIHFIVADIRNKNRLAQILEQEKPEIIFHAAAYKHVPLMELNYTEAISTNILGTENLLSATRLFLETFPEASIHFVNISTDKAVIPESIMGITKRASELLVYNAALESRNTTTNRLQTVSVRFGNVLGSSGSVIPLFWEQISKGGPLTVTHPEMERFFMTIPEAVNLVLHAVPISTGEDILALDMGQAVRIVDIAERLITLAGRLPHKDIKIIFTGIRPGEKLKEELFWKMGSIETDLPFIFRSKVDLRVIDIAAMKHTITDALDKQYSHGMFRDLLLELIEGIKP